MRSRTLRVCAAVLSVAMALSVASADDAKNCKDAGRVPPSTEPSYEFYLPNQLPFWMVREAVDGHWSPQAQAKVDLFPAKEILTAIAAVADRTPPTVNYVEREDYAPINEQSTEAEKNYRVGAGQYEEKQFAEAIQFFDLVLADKTSPLRAAAAYSAARAALLMGRYEDGIKRIDRLVDDNSLAEFHAAALRLLGTLNHHYGTPSLLAARLAQASYALSAPERLKCRYPDLERIAGEAEADLPALLGWIDQGARLETAGASAKFAPSARDVTADGDNDDETAVRKNIMPALAAQMPAIDLHHTLTASTPFEESSRWLNSSEIASSLDSGDLWRNRYGALNRNKERMLAARTGAAQITAHAKERWLATKNPAWALAYARRATDLAAVGIVKEAIASLETQPDTPLRRSYVQRLRKGLTAQAVRILLMSGRMTEAAALIREQAVAMKTVAALSYDGWYGPDPRPNWQYELDGGIRLYLEERDLASARQWAERVSAILKEANPSDYWLVRPNAVLAIVIARTPQELVAAAPGDSGSDFTGRRAFLTAADWLPARTLAEMAKNTKVSAQLRRGLLAAAWVRMHVLGRKDEVMALLPLLRELFPELKGDIDDIANASFAFARDHAIASLLLRAPGFSPRASWARSEYNQPKNIFAIDGENPSDGNWWCPLSVDQMKMDLASAFVDGPINLSIGEIDRGNTYAAWPQIRNSYLGLSTEFIAWHPLFKHVDKAELDALSRIDSGPKMLTERSVAWANWSNWFTWALGFDTHLPETLHLAVRSTRYGCRRNGSHAAYSRAAFEYLHDHYPQSEWAKKTPFWFGEFKR